MGCGIMKEEFVSPRLFVVEHIGPLTNKEIAALPDDELAAYLKTYGFDEAKRTEIRADDCTAI